MKFPSIFLFILLHRTHKEIILKIPVLILILIARPHLFAFLRSIAHTEFAQVWLSTYAVCIKSIHLLDVNKKTQHFAHHYATNNKKPYHRHNRYNFFHSISIVLFCMLSHFSLLSNGISVLPLSHSICHIILTILR